MTIFNMQNLNSNLNLDLNLKQIITWIAKNSIASTSTSTSSNSTIFSWQKQPITLKQLTAIEALSPVFKNTLVLHPHCLNHFIGKHSTTQTFKHLQFNIHVLQHQLNSQDIWERKTFIDIDGIPFMYADACTPAPWHQSTYFDVASIDASLGYKIHQPHIHRSDFMFAYAIPPDAPAFNLDESSASMHNIECILSRKSTFEHQLFINQEPPKLMLTEHFMFSTALIKLLSNCVIFE